MAREILPSEYIQLFNNLHYPAQPLSDDAKRACLALFDAYPAVTRLEEHLPFDGTYTDDQIIHIIDRELDRNPHLLRPTPESYVPWATYDISVMVHGHKTKKSVATTYYHTWQIHQVYQLQKYPDLYKNDSLFHHVAQDYLDWSPRWLPNKTKVRDLGGMGLLWDAASFFATLYEREHTRTFALIPEHHGVKTLDDHQQKIFAAHLQKHTQFVVNRYDLSLDG